VAVLGALPAPEIIQAFKGTLDFYLYRGQVVCRSWPRSPSGPRSLPVQESAAVFKDLVQGLSNAPLIVQQAGRELTRGTSLTWRDATIQAAYHHMHTW